MWSGVAFILVTIAVASLLPASEAQLGNATHTTDDILDTYADADADSDTRIVKGKVTSSSLLVPWQIALYKNGYFVCGGSIISKNWVLTAASCVVKGGSYTVRAGTSKYKALGQVRSPSLIVIKGGYVKTAKFSDIALIKVNKPFVWSLAVQPVNLAKAQRTLPQKYFTSGGVILSSVTQAICQKSYSVANITITNQLICATGSKNGGCQGDTGGALVLFGIQFGIYSFGIGCDGSKYPGVYTNVRLQEAWIKKVITQHGGDLATWA